MHCTVPERRYPGSQVRVHREPPKKFPEPPSLSALLHWTFPLVTLGISVLAQVALLGEHASWLVQAPFSQVVLLGSWTKWVVRQLFSSQIVVSLKWPEAQLNIWNKLKTYKSYTLNSSHGAFINFAFNIFWANNRHLWTRLGSAHRLCDRIWWDRVLPGPIICTAECLLILTDEVTIAVNISSTLIIVQPSYGAGRAWTSYY